MVEDDEKWKCLICDPSYIREHRAIYWAILKYHKERKAKLANSSNTPVRGAKSVHQTGPNSAGKTRPQSEVKVNGVKPVGGHLESVRNVYKKLQSNSDVTVSPVSKNPSAQCNNVKRNGAMTDEPKHFVDQCLMDVDDCVQQMVYMLGEVKKAWKLSGKKSRDAMVVTSKLRKALELAKHNIDEVDKKVIEATTETKESPHKVKENIKAKPPKLSNVTKTEGQRPKAGSVESEEGIHDVSVDELVEVEAKESQVNNSQIEVKKDKASSPEKAEKKVNGSISNIDDEIGNIKDEIDTEEFSDDKPGDVENHEETEEETKNSRTAILNGKKSSSLNGHVTGECQ